MWQSYYIKPGVQALPELPVNIRIILLDVLFCRILDRCFSFRRFRIL